MEACNEIIPNLWLGSRLAPVNQYLIRNNNIKLIINCTKDIDYYTDSNVQTVRLAINDANTEESNRILGERIDDLTSLINIYLQNNLGVLVHCYAGVQRSATVVLCYLIKYKHLQLQMAKTIMKDKRSIVFFPYPTFDNFINKYSLTN